MVGAEAGFVGRRVGWHEPCGSGTLACLVQER
jgi:hypothetical protein